MLKRSFSAWTVKVQMCYRVHVCVCVDVHCGIPNTETFVLFVPVYLYGHVMQTHT